ncbi:MAG TPA: replication-associated recombination protein A [Flavobacteriales bacterium]|nr:replication-associated recombination protein A [Flavobacteriales bacterium]
MDQFAHTTPLAERVRPKTLDDFIGQEHIVGPGKPLRVMLEAGTVPSMIFWGPPGVGKTTLAGIIAKNTNRPFYELSAVQAGVKDVREVIERVKNQGMFGGNNAILFIDEIHRFNKSQQDSLLAAVEKGILTLIGATTENPSFEVNSALLSRCQVYVMQHLTKQDLLRLCTTALEKDEYLSGKKITIQEHDALLRFSGGDGRKLLNLLEMAVNSAQSQTVTITNKLVENAISAQPVQYDKTGEWHYDIISAFIKSIRGSDPNGAVYWMARMLAGGEDPKFIARRMVILASEDIGNANPTALIMATNCFTAITQIGMPEGRIVLSQCAVYLASSPKSNASYMAINDAMDLVEKTGNLTVPLHLRNAPTKLMKELNYGANYSYSHEGKNNFIEQEYLPDEIKNTKLYDPGKNAREEELRRFLKDRWKEKYDY